MKDISSDLNKSANHNEFAGFRLYHNKEFENFPLHWHGGIEIIMPVKNQCSVDFQQNKIVLQERDILLINIGTLHGLTSLPVGERVIMQVDALLLCVLKQFEMLLFMLPPTMVFRSADDTGFYRFIYNNLNIIINEYDNKKAFNEAFIYAKLIEIYGEIARQQIYHKGYLVEVSIEKQQSNIIAMLKTCEYINLHFMEKLTLDQVAAISGFSKFHFTKVFKQFTNMTYCEYLNQRRIKHALLLLNNKDMNITEVAMNSGFNSISTFNRIFRKINGHSPSFYRNKSLWMWY